MCNKAVDDFLTGLKFVPDWFATSKMIKKLVTALYADTNILYFNEDSDNAVFSCNKWVFLVLILIISTLLIPIMMKMIQKLLFILDFWLGILNLKKVKHLKKS